MVEEESPSVLPGHSAPVGVISSSNKGGYILVANALGLIIVLLASGLRIHMRIRSRFAGDDVALAASTIVGLVQGILVFIQVSKGMGKSVEDIDGSGLIQVQKIGYASDIVFLFALYLSKISTLLLIKRLVICRVQQGVLKAGLAVSVVLGVVSVFLAALRCDLARPWLQYGQQCDGLFVRWQVVAALDIIVEAGTFAASIGILVGLQMAFAQKLKVVVAFSFRLPLIAFAVLRLRELNKAIGSSDPTLIGAIAVVWTQVEQHYSNVASTIPCINPMMNAISTNFGAMGKAAVAAKESRYGTGSHALDSLRSKTLTGTADDGSEFKIRPDVNASNVTKITADSGPGADKHSVASDDSRRNMISKVVHWTVQSETESPNP